MRGLTMVAVLFCGVSVPAVAADQQPEDKIVCKRDTKFSTGSHLSRPRKTCLRASEWRELEEESQRNVDKLRDRRGVDPEHVPLTSGSAPG